MRKVDINKTASAPLSKRMEPIIIPTGVVDPVEALVRCVDFAEAFEVSGRIIDDSGIDDDNITNVNTSLLVKGDILLVNYESVREQHISLDHIKQRGLEHGFKRFAVVTLTNIPKSESFGFEIYRPEHHNVTGTISLANMIEVLDKRFAKDAMVFFCV